MNNKEAIISQITMLLTKLIDDEHDKNTSTAKPDEQPVELLTIKECTHEIKGLAENTVRQLVAQGKIPCIRSGRGKNGKILIAKTALLNYFKTIS